MATINENEYQLMLDNFETVDDLFDYFIDSDGGMFTVEYILTDAYETLLRILKSKDNKHSEYDLMIINAANSFIWQNHDNQHKRCIDDILEIYRNRK